MTTEVGLLADHYQKTFELTLETWERRNRTFLLLLVVVGVATLLTFNVAQAEPLLVDWIAKLLGITDGSRIRELRGSFPYGILQSILLMVIFYLTVVLYHRTATIHRFYKYLALIEPEIRHGMNLSPHSHSFTRESTFYLKHKPFLGRFVAASYVGSLGLLLVSFLGARIFTDFSHGNFGVGLSDLVVALPTGMFFYAYARTS